MTVLDKKLVRDLWHLQGQVVTVSLVVASGIASYVAMRSSYESFARAQQMYYARYRFADVFVHLKRAPDSISAQITTIPGVSSVQTRVVVEVNLDVPSLSEPAQGRLISIPERPISILNDLFLRQGRYIEPNQRHEVLISEAFATANRLRVGETIGAVINGRWEPLHIVGIALSPDSPVPSHDWHSPLPPHAVHDDSFPNTSKAPGISSPRIFPLPWQTAQFPSPGESQTAQV